MSGKVPPSLVIRDTYANIVALSGLPENTRAFATDLGRDVFYQSGSWTVGISNKRVITEQLRQTESVKLNPRRNALIAAPLWASGTAYTQGCIRQHSSGNLMLCITSGTSGGSEPAFSSDASMTDNTAAWWSMGQYTGVITGHEVPTITHQSTNPSGMSSYNFNASTVNQAKVLSITCPLWVDVSSTTTNSYLFNTGSSSNHDGLGAGKAAPNKVIAFQTESKSVAISRYNVAGERIRVYVDDILVEEGPSDFIAGSPSHMVVQFTGRRLRKWRIEMNGSQNLKGIWIDSQCTLLPDSIDNCLIAAWYSDSYGQTVSPTDNVQKFLSLSSLIARGLGYRYCLDYTSGGTGYITNASVGGALNVNSLIDTVSTTVDTRVAHVFCAHGYNDVITAGLSVSDVVNAAEAVWQKMLVKYPAAVVSVIGPWSASTGPSATITGLDSALAARVTSVANPRIIYTSGAVVSGTGKSSSLAGSGNSDYYTGPDGTHPTRTGVRYISERIIDDIHSKIVRLTNLLP